VNWDGITGTEKLESEPYSRDSAKCKPHRHSLWLKRIIVSSRLLLERAWGASAKTLQFTLKTKI